MGKISTCDYWSGISTYCCLEHQTERGIYKQTLIVYFSGCYLQELLLLSSTGHCHLRELCLCLSTGFCYLRELCLCLSTGIYYLRELCLCLSVGKKIISFYSKPKLKFLRFLSLSLTADTWIQGLQCFAVINSARSYSSCTVPDLSLPALSKIVLHLIRVFYTTLWIVTIYKIRPQYTIVVKRNAAV